MKQVLVPPDFESWRDAAREALQQGYRPEELNLLDSLAPGTLALSFAVESKPTGSPITAPHVPRRFLEDAAFVAAHSNPERWNLLYRLLFRLQQDRHLLDIQIDEDVSEMSRLASQVRRDLHKMHAFVRFRKVAGAEGDDEQEYYVAWHRPDHRILNLAAPFFAERFAVMRWSILTPYASVSWDPLLKQLHFGPGVPRDAAPAEDELEGLWRTYYSSIFNPARLNLNAMRAEMPVRYWKNLPEISEVPRLISQSKDRVATMVSQQQGKTSAAAWVPAEHTISEIKKALPACEGCDLFRHATQAVPGNGPPKASLLVIGEQPGDQEDQQGLPFVGPAGRLLDQVLKELGIDRTGLYVTNAVKHFKFVQRGKLRLHQNPRMSEITACRPWLAAEIDAIQPKVVLCLGASAAKSLLGGTFALMKDRGKVLSAPAAEQVIATLHPSAILRARDDESREGMMAMLKSDLMTAAKLAELL